MSDIKSLVEGKIKNNFIVLFTKSYCPYCRKALETLGDLGENFENVVLDQMEDGQAIQDYLLQKTHQKTVPNIFIGQHHVGGNDDLNAAKKSGELQRLLSARS
ncbi:hypothetical protein G9A89_007389 [Geosiphon pyriformis]|nr:hypothetical protein G9A89_007389 [Geosiphon pyriformis]